jgi:glycosyltransferase involved in cell wall biosynthesis
MSRNVRNVQYLPRYEWTPVVLAPRDAGDLMDPDALALVPAGAEVIRARCPGPAQLRPAVRLARQVARMPRGSLRIATGHAGHAPRRPGTGTTPGASANAEHAAPPVASWLWRLRRLVLFPDDEIGWLPFAVVSAIRAHRARKFDALYSTSSPVTAHLVAGVVKRLTGVPWVAEFRDPWVGNPLADRLPWLHRRLQARLERWIVHSADGLVFVSPSTTRLYRRRYPRAAPMHTITNGHDRSETVRPRPAAPASRRYRIVWTGTLYRPAELEQFLEALEALIARRPDLADRLEVRFFDTCRRVQTGC